MDMMTGRALERQISAKRREIARLRQDMRLREAEMGTLIAGGGDAAAVADDVLDMRRRLSRLIIEREALMDGLVFQPEAG
jgi:hypothetical protein